MRTFGTKRHRLWTVVLALSAVCVAGWFGLTRASALRAAGDGSITAIVDAANDMQYRPLQGRLTGAFAYRPLRSNARRSSSAQSKSKARLYDLSSRLAADDATPRQLHERGIALLLLENVEAGIDALETALRRETREEDIADAVQKSRNGRLIGDLAAGYLERARRTQTVTDRIACLAAAQRAWTLEQTAENAWNRAAALELLHFRDAIRAAWADFVRIDSASEWSVEARARLASLEQPTLTDSWANVQPRLEAIALQSNRDELRAIVARFPQQVRVQAEDVLLVRWATSGDEAAWRALRPIGEILAAERGEHLVRDAVAGMDDATPERRRRLAAAYRRYVTSKQLYDARQPLEALSALQEASRTFEAEGSPALASLADVVTASATFFTERYADAFRIASRGLERLDEAERYPSLIVRLEWVRALCHGALGRPHESLRSYDRALAAAERAGERDSVAALQNLRGEALEAIGDGEVGLEWRLRAVQTKNAVGGRNKTEQILAGATRTLFAQGRADVALQLIDVTAAHPQFGDSADFASEVLLLRALILQKLERNAEAGQVLAKAREYALKSGDSGVRTAMLADVDAALALNDTAAEPAAVRIGRLTAAIAHAQRTDNHYHLSRFFLQRARAEREGGTAAAAEADLRAGLEEVEQRRRTIAARELRALYFASARELVMELVDLLLRQNRIGEAFDVAEAARAQGLLERDTRVESHAPLRHDRIMAGLAPGETLLSNLALPDRLVTWIVSRGGIEVVSTSIARRALERLLARHDSDERDADRAVYDAVMASADDGSVRRLVYVRDPSLAPVTLAVLKDRRGAYLSEKYPIVYQASATAHLRSRENRQRIAEQRPRVFAGAASFFDRALSDSLLPLPTTETEVDLIEQVRGGVMRISGRDLTAARFLSEAENAEIVHFAGHTLGGSAAGAALVMAPANGNAGLLYAQEIARHSFARTRLVVLSACGVTSRRDVDARGVGSIAYAFLAAGVPAVIASPRPVDDQMAADFMPRLHAELLRSRDAAVALQSTQLSFIRSSDPAMRDPRRWAAFRLYGDYGE